MRASSLIESGGVVELFGYELSPEVDRDAFSAAWRATADKAPRPAGLLYRDLARQVPEWNQKIQGEIMQPNPYAFIDYSLFRSAAEHAAHRAGGGGTPPPLSGNPQRTEGVFHIAFRFVRPETLGEPGMLLYNIFQVQGGEAVEEGFVSRWPERAQYQSQQAGFYSAILHRKARPEQPLTAFNRAEWQDADCYAQTLAGFERNFPRTARAAAGQGPGTGAPPVGSFLGLFQIVHALT
jgi:hypothetical protein